MMALAAERGDLPGLLAVLAAVLAEFTLAVGVDDRVFLLRHAHGLPASLRDGCRCALDDRIVAERIAGHAVALHLDARLEPGPQPLVVDALAPPPHQVARPGLATSTIGTSTIGTSTLSTPAPLAPSIYSPFRARIVTL